MRRNVTSLLAARSALIDMEYRLLRTQPQIGLEVMLCFFSGGGSCEVGNIYRNVRATEAAVRRHLRQLEAQDLITQQRAQDDRRKTLLTLTDKGRALQARYMSEVEALISQGASAQAKQAE